MDKTETVLVRCVWPESRGEKDDCRGGTKTVWAGHGDVQPYPAHLWPKLAEHPDVWQLADAPAESDGTKKLKATKADKDLAAGNATDLVRTLPFVTSDELAGMTDEQVREAAVARGIKLHPRLAPGRLRPQFLEAQGVEAAPFPTTKD